MSITFDQELERITHEITALKNKTQTSKTMTHSFSETSNLLKKEEANFIASVSQIVRLAKKKRAISNEKQAIITWCETLAKSCKQYFEKITRVSQKAFWLGVVEHRVGTKSSSKDRDQDYDDVMNLAIKLSELHDTEKSLNKQINELKTQRDDLQKRYSQLEIADDNWYAAASLQSRLGKNFKEAARSPILTQLDELFSTIELSAKQKFERAIASTLQQNFKTAQEKLFQISKMLTTQVELEQDKVDVVELLEIEDEIEHVKRIRDAFKENLKELQEKPIEQARPHLY